MGKTIITIEMSDKLKTSPQLSYEENKRYVLDQLKKIIAHEEMKIITYIESKETRNTYVMLDSDAIK